MPPLSGNAAQIDTACQIRIEVNAAFDTFERSVLSDSNQSRPQDRAETASLLALLREHRTNVMAVSDARHFIERWREPAGSLQSLVDGDRRWKAIAEARATRRSAVATIAPVRYLGFDDAAGMRIYKFGRLPALAGAEVFRVRMPVDQFLRHKISFQDGPSMCSTIMAAAAEPKDHLVTDADSESFISRRPVKAERKPFARKADRPEQ
jgi:hypothetical protein